MSNKDYWTNLVNRISEALKYAESVENRYLVSQLRPKLYRALERRSEALRKDKQWKSAIAA